MKSKSPFQKKSPLASRSPFLRLDPETGIDQAVEDAKAAENNKNSQESTPTPGGLMANVTSLAEQQQASGLGVKEFKEANPNAGLSDAAQRIKASKDAAAQVKIDAGGYIAGSSGEPAYNDVVTAEQEGLGESVGYGNETLSAISTTTSGERVGGVNDPNSNLTGFLDESGYATEINEPADNPIGNQTQTYEDTTVTMPNEQSVQDITDQAMDQAAAENGGQTQTQTTNVQNNVSPEQNANLPASVGGKNMECGDNYQGDGILYDDLNDAI